MTMRAGKPHPKSDLPAAVIRQARAIFGPSEYCEDDVAWPYGMSGLNGKPEWQRELVDWASSRGLVADWTGCACLAWLLRGESVNCWEVEELPGCRPLRIDHLVAFTRDGKPAVITNSPYDVGHAELTNLAALGTHPEVHVTVDGGWYHRGAVGTYVWNRRQHDAWTNRDRTATGN